MSELLTELRSETFVMSLCISSSIFLSSDTTAFSELTLFFPMYLPVKNRINAIMINTAVYTRLVLNAARQ